MRSGTPISDFRRHPRGIAAAELSDALRDPADCLIVPTALNHSSRLVTKDRRIREAQIVATIW
jgi:PIN domain nuclease of toxin-antitoxin system